MRQENRFVLRLLSYNIQVAIGSHRFHHMLSHSLRYLMPHGQSFQNLDRIAETIVGYDIVALNEADAGSMRTRFVNQAEYLAQQAGYGHWGQMITRDLGRLAQHTNSVVSRHDHVHLTHHRLPSLQEGRGVLEVHYHLGGRDVVVLITHLGLSRRARLVQMHFICELVNQYPHVILMGDMNCLRKSSEMSHLLAHTTLQLPEHCPATFPSWNPARAIDHILISDTMRFDHVAAINQPLSDHLALSATVSWE